MSILKVAGKIQTNLFKKIADETLRLTKGLDNIKAFEYYDEYTTHFNNVRGMSSGSANISFVKATTATALHNLADREPVGLNFASARHPGGGFLSGAQAQEEDICRRSSLYHSLRECASFYNGSRDTLYTDRMIYSPTVAIVRDADLNEISPEYCSIISCAAPNNCHNYQESVLKPIFERRIANVLELAVHQGHSIIVLGAWGCGAFKNNPEMVATAFKEVIPRYSNIEMVFAIPDDKNLDVFKRILQ